VPDRAAIEKGLAVVRDAILDAWALLQPIECLGCAALDRALCERCRAAIAAAPPRPVACDADVPVLVWCAADYEGPVREAILSLKERSRPDAARPLAGILATAVAAALAAIARDGTQSVELAWVPSSRAALRRRGLDPVLAVIDAARLPRSRVLRSRSGAAQKRLARRERLAIAPDRFRARSRLDGRRFLLVDDVATTGATLAAAIAAIERAGGRVLAAAVIAAPAFSDRSGMTERFRQ